MLITGEGLQGSDAGQPSAATTELRQIHEENLKTLSSMSEKEILEEQAKLKQMIGRYLVKLHSSFSVVFLDSCSPSFLVPREFLDV